jgi:hypothetical protein
LPSGVRNNRASRTASRTDPVPTEIARQEIVMKARYHFATLAVASAILFGAAHSAMAADEWFMLSQQTLKTADPSTEIKSEGGRWAKDVKKTKLSVEGADVEITKVVFGWDNRPDDTVTSVGTIKSGGETAPHNAPGLKGRLNSVRVEYKILGGAPTATLKVWGFD